MKLFSLIYLFTINILKSFLRLIRKDFNIALIQYNNPTCIISSSANIKKSKLNNNIAIYGVGHHRHMPEIDQVLSENANKKISITFTPHLIPTFRGILSTIYVELSKNIKIEDVYKCLVNFYKKEQFVRILDFKNMVNTNEVLNSNYCNISVYKNRFNRQIIIASSIDNLVKGAAGQAVQNFNIRYGYKESLAII